MNASRVSVVMGVWNGEASLHRTLDSVLSQEGVEFEFIVVDDGSTDNTATLLAARATSDSRLRVLTQAHAGLTRALAAGCRAARSEYIARQDCGDQSLPGRLAEQAALLDAQPQVVLTACGVRFVAPQGEPLFETGSPGPALEHGLAIDDPLSFRGPPHHGATMFRRWAYEQVGGYRPAFVVAQDIDLWLRLAEVGGCMGTGACGYEAHMQVGSISAQRRDDQLRAQAVAIECARVRRSGGDDSALVERLAGEQWPARVESTSKERARFLYFLGACLRSTDRRAARRYWRQSLREDPLMFKSLLRLVVPPW